MLREELEAFLAVYLPPELRKTVLEGVLTIFKNEVVDMAYSSKHKEARINKKGSKLETTGE